MALHFHKSPIIHSATTLKTLVSRYSEYTTKTDYPIINEDSYEKCRSTITLRLSGVRQIREGRENLKTLYSEIRDEYKNCKNKSERKDLMLEIEEIEQESKLQEAIAEANDLMYMLIARFDESKCIKQRMDVKLGYTSQKSQSREGTSDDPDVEINQGYNCEDGSSGNNRTQTASDSAADPDRIHENQGRYRSIKPPQASLPKFYGSVEEFPEYWAVFETLVHRSKELDIMEKILLLKESLKGRAQNIIKGIRLVPENYEWIIQTLKQNYSDDSTNRSQIVQKLAQLKPANNFADSCSDVFDQVHVLVNQMVSAGYDVRKTYDPMWCETILSKFPREVIKPVLILSKAQSNQTVEDLLGHLKEEVAAKAYVENRLGRNRISEVASTTDKRNKARPQSGDQTCVFCNKGNHSSIICRTITDQTSRRKMLTEGRRCWKCCSSNHSSFDCQKPDCPKCGQKHHISLCLKSEMNPSRNQTKPWNSQQKFRGNGRNNQRSEFPQRDRRFPFNQGDHGGMTENNTQMCSKVAPTFDQNTTLSQLVLMTAEGNIWNHKEKDYEKVLFFFDSGAQKTVIEESLVERLGVPKQTSELCTMSGIGGHIECFKSHMVDITLSTAFG